MSIRNATALLAIGILVGFGFAKYFEPKSQTEFAKRTSDDSRTSSPRFVDRPGKQQVDQEALSSLDRILNSDSEFTRRFELFELAASATVGELQNLTEASLALGNDAQTRLVLQVVMTRFAESSPYEGIFVAQGLTLPYSDFALYELFGVWSLTDFDGALDGINSLDDESAQQVAAQAVADSVSHWLPREAEGLLTRLPVMIDENESTKRRLVALTKIDPQMAAHQAVLEGKANDLSTVGKTWASFDPESALEFGRNLRKKFHRERFLRGVFSEWARRDHSTALEILSTFDGEEKSRYSNDVLSAMVKKGHQLEAMEWALQYGDFSSRYYLMRGSYTPRSLNSQVGHVLSSWVREDPYAAINYATSNELAKYLPQIAQSFFYAKPQEAAAWVRGLDDEPMKTRIMSQALYGLTRSEPLLAVELAKELGPSPTQTHLMQRAIQEIADMDPALAASIVLDTQLSNDNRQMLSDIAVRWARKDPYAALDWANAMSQTDSAKALPAVVASWAEHHDAQAAANYCLENQQLLKNRKTAQVVFTALARSDRAASIDWVNQVSAPGLNRGLERVFREWAEENVQAALGSADQLRDPKKKGWALSGVVREWAARDPQAAAEYALDMPDNDNSGRVMGSVVGSMARQDRRKSLEWAQSLPDGKRKDNAIHAVVTNSQTPSAELVDLASSIRDKRLRSQGLTSALYGLASQDPVAASRLLKKADMSESDKDRISKYLDELL